MAGTWMAAPGKGSHAAAGGGSAPTFIQEAETPWNSSPTSRTTASISVVAGDVLVAFVVEETSKGATETFTISGGSLVWTLQEEIDIIDYPTVFVWTATVDSDKSMTVLFTRTATDDVNWWWGGNVLNFRGTSGVGAAEKTNVSSGAPSLNITTTQANSVLVSVSGDWNATDGASRTWRTVNSITPTSGNGMEVTYFRDASHFASYGAYYSNAGSIASKTVGLSAPGAQKYSIAAVEVKAP